MSAGMWARRLDWPLCRTLDNIVDAIFSARTQRIGVRIPTLLPGMARLHVEPPVQMSLYLARGLEKEGLFRKAALNTSRNSHVFEFGSATAVLWRAYFPEGHEPATEWHVEYSIEFENVAEELIPAAFKQRETEPEPEHWPTIRPDEFQEFESFEHLEYDG